MNATDKRTGGNQVGSEGSLAKILEVGFWGAIIWGVLRIAAHFLNFTPYGVFSFSRPFLGRAGEHSWQGFFAGLLLLIILSIAATTIFTLLLMKIRHWWVGLIYGLLLLLLFGLFFQMGRWRAETLFTELGWFLTYGLFVGMSMTLEEYDRE
ncbi:YqhR family membrane protein [Brevibacillus sp. B_LB10_24]|uniref:YqhR family membrane protein n=1 Tax=Brevibacillus TaxID=55080 RepID=UPI0003802B2A|nr:YqhR family membrane protein [Brevibacillus massiliensis]